jgi:hypothetical protein
MSDALGISSLVVVVHGGFGGRGNGRRSRAGVIRAGHDVFTPMPTAVGERAHLAAPDVAVDSYVDDLVAVV